MYKMTCTHTRINMQRQMSIKVYRSKVKVMCPGVGRTFYSLLYQLHTLTRSSNPCTSDEIILNNT